MPNPGMQHIGERLINHPHVIPQPTPPDSCKITMALIGVAVIIIALLLFAGSEIFEKSDPKKHAEISSGEAVAILIIISCLMTCKAYCNRRPPTGPDRNPPAGPTPS